MSRNKKRKDARTEAQVAKRPASDEPTVTPKKKPPAGCHEADVLQPKKKGGVSGNKKGVLPPAKKGKKDVVPVMKKPVCGLEPIAWKAEWDPTYTGNRHAWVCKFYRTAERRATKHGFDSAGQKAAGRVMSERGAKVWDDNH